VPAAVGVSVPDQPEPDTVALLQLLGATLADPERPSCTPVAAGETLPASEIAVPAIPVVGGLEMEIVPELPGVPTDF
jgi:hypothetical protein